MAAVLKPLDLVKVQLNHQVCVKCKDSRILTGTMQAFDTHLNMVLTDVQELSEDNMKRNLKTVFIRGDGIILVSPLV